MARIVIRFRLLYIDDRNGILGVMLKPMKHMRIAAILIGFFLFAGCKSRPAPAILPEDPEASLKFIAVEASDVLKLNLSYSLKTQNPRAESADVRIENWNALINGAKMNESLVFLPQISPEKPVLIAPAGTGTVPGSSEIAVGLEMDILALSAAGLILGDDFKVDLDIDLVFSYSPGTSVQVRVRETAIFPCIREPVFSITAIAVLKAELINTRFRVNLKVENPNPFPMELSSFAYELYGDGRLWADGRERNVLKIPPRQTREAQLFLIMNFINMNRPLLDQVIRLEDINYRFAGEATADTGIDYLNRFKSIFDLSGYTRVLEN